ncbi:AAA family ATPase [Rathayibacter sp. AY1E2]|uniref:AAA family ATPase n=1 Tax=Rathayibacter sp. AY1E2 TaxID=2080550 RepID=UPI0021581114|nr:AAA family ATPase [Rathayibacter sp. AY1E2]
MFFREKEPRVRLGSVSVRKYRSIDKQAEFQVADFTVLVGANNQGKSNLLKATVLAMHAIEGWAQLPPVFARRSQVPLLAVFRSSRASQRQRRESNLDYDWDRDFPLFARDRRGAQKSTIIQLNFELDDAEQAAFKSATGISINSHLPVQVSFDVRSAALTIPKQGKGNHGEKAQEIAAFVAARIGLLYVPAVRTSAAALRVVEEILATRRRAILESKRYASLVKELEELDAKAVTEVENVLTSTLRRFVPTASGVTVQTSSLSRSRGVDEILIDDGVSTSLATKGDGIQSLVALGLTLEWTRSTAHPDKQLVIAVEEPESHLHPGAVHELRKVLQGIAETQQVIVTTHSQSLVNRRSLSQNVIVGDRAAKAAKDLDQLRHALGVRLSDALSAAEVILIGEGIHDELTLRILLSTLNPAVKASLDDGRVLVEAAGGGSRIYSRVLAARTILTTPIVMIDGDDAGKKDVERLLAEGIVESTFVVQATRPHHQRSELEDLFEVDTYLAALEAHIKFSFSAKERGSLDKDRIKAWSEKLEDILTSRGMPNAKGEVVVAKAIVNAAIQRAVLNGDVVLRSECVPLIDRLQQLILQSLRPE